MSVLGNLAVSDDIQESRDTVGGNGPLDSGVYPATIKAVYLKKSAGGALSANIHMDIEGREIRQALWITSGDAKGNRNYYERDGQKRYLPGFELFRSLSLMTTGKEPSDLEPEDGVMKLWNPDEKKELPTEVPLVKELTGAQIQVGLMRERVDKTERADDGSYVPTGETREQNEVDKFFHAENGLTLVEALAGETEGKFINTWRDKWTGQVRDKSTGGTEAPAGSAPATPAANTGATAPKKSLFG